MYVEGPAQVSKMMRGTVINHRRRCGRPNCRCASGQYLHASIVLSYSENKRTRFLMLDVAEVESVRAATQAYRDAKASLAEQADAGLAELLVRHGRQPRSD